MPSFRSSTQRNFHPSHSPHITVQILDLLASEDKLYAVSPLVPFHNVIPFLSGILPIGLIQFRQLIPNSLISDSKHPLGLMNPS